MNAGYPIKLVRDRVQEVDTSEGIAFRPVRDREEHVKLLREKLGEEAIEYIVDPSVGELVDVVEAVEALVRVDLQVDVTEFWQAIREKREERGGFEDGTVMETVEP